LGMVSYRKYRDTTFYALVYIVLAKENNNSNSNLAFSLVVWI
jgi:hypothetical protein